MAIIACLLILIDTDRTPTKRTFEMICLYLCGWEDLDELEAHIARLRALASLAAQATSQDRLRRARRVASACAVRYHLQPRPHFFRPTSPEQDAKPLDQATGTVELKPRAEQYWMYPLFSPRADDADGSGDPNSA